MIYLPSYLVPVIWFMCSQARISAQPSILNKNIKIDFPTADWVEAAPPSHIRDLYETKGSGKKLIFYATSSASQLRLFITQWDYPTTYELSSVLAGYLDGVQKRSTRQASGEVRQRLFQFKNFPVHAYACNVQDSIYFETRTVLCDGHLYTLEIGGPLMAKEEATQCLDG